MGLCKCRNVTNLFCFEHRKNVCEKCISSDHVKCVVKSYLQWLQDSDYDAACQICHESLEQGDLLRLNCLDIFHRKCISELCEKLPETTAPAGYACPVCNASVIPPDNVNTQIAETVRVAFANAKWAQNIIPKKSTMPLEPPKIPQNAHVVTNPVISSHNDSVSIETGILPTKKVATKPSVGTLRDADDDKYGKSGNLSANWTPRGRFLSPKRLAFGTVVAIVLVIFLYYFII
ncbi:Zinc finger protein-like 1 [Podochytrium sp. JEL0797]|nr:Zinc finger protein-like 1 [Podochytrium sp. JEL0797]